MSGPEWNEVLNALMLAFPPIEHDPDRAVFLRKQFIDFHFDDVQNALLDYLATGEKFLETGPFMKAVLKRHNTRYASAPVDRTACYLAELKRAERQAAASWNEADAVIARAGGDAVEAAKRAVLESVPDAMRLGFLKRGLDGSLTFKAMVAERLQGRTAAA